MMLVDRLKDRIRLFTDLNHLASAEGKAEDALVYYGDVEGMMNVLLEFEVQAEIQWVAVPNGTRKISNICVNGRYWMSDGEWTEDWGRG